MTYSHYLASRNYQPAPVIRTEKREGDLVLERGKILEMKKGRPS